MNLRIPNIVFFISTTATYWFKCMFNRGFQRNRIWLLCIILTCIYMKLTNNVHYFLFNCKILVLGLILSCVWFFTTGWLWAKKRRLLIVFKFLSYLSGTHFNYTWWLWLLLTFFGMSITWIQVMSSMNILLWFILINRRFNWHCFVHINIFYFFSRFDQRTILALLCLPIF